MSEEKAKMSLTKEQKDLVEEYAKSDEYKQLLYKYVALRTGKGGHQRASIYGDLVELAKKFVEKYADKLPKMLLDTLIKKFARRFQDMMQEAAAPLVKEAQAKKAPEKKEEKTYALLLDSDTPDCRTLVETAESQMSGFGKLYANTKDELDEESMKHITVLENKDDVTELFVKYVHDRHVKSQAAAPPESKYSLDALVHMLAFAVVRMANAIEDVSEDVNDISSTLRDALIVKEGDLIDRKTKKPKHVGWSWLHSIQSELAQIRGLSADKDDKDDKENKDDKPWYERMPQFVPVPYYAPPPYTPPSRSGGPDINKWPYIQPSEPPDAPYPYITCSSCANNAGCRTPKVQDPTSGSAKD